MADDFVNWGSDTGGSGNADAGQLSAWIHGASQRVAQGLPLDQSGQWDPARGKFGVPLGYKVDNGQLVQDSNLWGATWPGLLGMAGMGGLGALLGPASGALGSSAPSLEGIAAGPGATTLPAAGSPLASNSIDAGLFTAPSSASSGAVADALGGGLSSTPIGTGAIAAPSSSPSGAVASALSSAGGGGVSNTVKALTTLASVLGGKGIAAATGGIPSQLTDLLNNAVQRQNQQKPLGVAVDQGMYRMLPNYATQGVGNTPTGAQGLKALFGGS